VLKDGEFHLTAEQLHRIVRAGGSLRNQVMLQTFVQTGIRRSELAALSVSDISQGRQLLVIRQGKGDKMRLVPVSGALLADLMELIGQRTAGHVFLSRNGGGLSTRQINRIVAAAGRRAGVTNPNPKYRQITCHLFRHSFARLWKSAGGSLESLSKILGHASVKTTIDVYGTESLADVQRNYESTIAGLFHADTGGRSTPCRCRVTAEESNRIGGRDG